MFTTTSFLALPKPTEIIAVGPLHCQSHNILVPWMAVTVTGAILESFLLYQTLLNYRAMLMDSSGEASNPFTARLADLYVWRRISRMLVKLLGIGVGFYFFVPPSACVIGLRGAGLGVAVLAMMMLLTIDSWRDWRIQMVALQATPPRRLRLRIGEWLVRLLPPTRKSP